MWRRNEKQTVFQTLWVYSLDRMMVSFYFLEQYLCVLMNGRKNASKYAFEIVRFHAICHPRTSLLAAMVLGLQICVCRIHIGQKAEMGRC